MTEKLFLWNQLPLNVTGPRWWFFQIGWGNGLVCVSTKSSHQYCVAAELKGHGPIPIPNCPMLAHILLHWPGPWFNIKTLFYHYRKYHYGDKTILRLSYLHNGISYTGKTASLYWFGALYSPSIKEKGTSSSGSRCTTQRSNTITPIGSDACNNRHRIVDSSYMLNGFEAT